MSGAEPGAQAWPTEEALIEATERFAAAIPGYRIPAAVGVARRDGDTLTFGHVNPPGAVRPLPAVVLATVAGYADSTGVHRLTRERFAEAVRLATPAEASTHIPHPNLWSWRELLAGGSPASEFLVFFVADVDDPVVDEDDEAFRTHFTR